MKGTTAAVLAMLAVLHALTVLLSAKHTPNSVLASNQQRIADSGSVFIGTIILRRQQQRGSHTMTGSLYHFDNWQDAESHTIDLAKAWIDDHILTDVQSE